MATLPLFPLGGVLVPGELLGLQLFEPRYLRLHLDVMARREPEREVGVIHIARGHEVGVGRHGELARVGCAGVVREFRTIRVDEQPRVAWLLQGRRRFRLDHVDETAGTPYLTGEITWLDHPDDPGAEPDPRLLDLHAQAAEAGLSVADRQRLLEVEDVDEALALGLRLMDTERRLRRLVGGRPARQPLGGESLN